MKTHMNKAKLSVVPVVVAERITGFMDKKDHQALSSTCKLIHGPVDLNSRQRAISFFKEGNEYGNAGICIGLRSILDCTPLFPIALSLGIIVKVGTPIVALLMYVGYATQDLAHYRRTRTNVETSFKLNPPQARELEKGTYKKQSNHQPTVFKVSRTQTSPSSDPVENLALSTYIP